MYATRPSRRLHAAELMSSPRAVEGEALVDTARVMTAGEAAASGEFLMRPTAEPNVLEAVDTMQTVRPVECPPCPPPTVLYRTVTKMVPGPAVPGPTQYVYVRSPAPSREMTPEGQPGSIGFDSYDDWWNALGREAGLPYDPPTAVPGGPGPLSIPEQAGVAGGFPWWLLLAAGGIWLATRKKR